MTKPLRIPNEPRFVRAFALVLDPGDALSLLLEIGALGSRDLSLVRRTREALDPAYDRASDLKDWDQTHSISVLRKALAQSDSAAYLAYNIRGNQQAVHMAAEYAEALAVVGCAADTLTLRRRPWQIEPDDLSLPEWRQRIWKLLFAMPGNALPKPATSQAPADPGCTCSESGNPKALAGDHASWCPAHCDEGSPRSPTSSPASAASSANPSPQVTVSRVHYLVLVDGTLHHVRRDRVCDCGATPQFPCPAIPLVQDYLAAGCARPLGRHESTWSENWVRIPPLCPVCDCPTIPDRYLNSRAGPGWRCSLTGCEHFWMVRMNPLRRYLAKHRPELRYPWYDAPEEERRAWLEAHCHPPRVAPSPSTAEAPLPTRTESDPEQYPLAFPLPWPVSTVAQTEPPLPPHPYADAERITPCPHTRSTALAGPPSIPAASSERRV
jgi:hypothetical protein